MTPYRLPLLVAQFIAITALLAACGGGTTTVTVTDSAVTTATATEESTTTTAGDTTVPRAYEGKASALLVPLGALPEGWTLDRDEEAPAKQDSPRTIFYSGLDSRVAPIEPGVVSGASRRYASGSGLSTEVAQHVVLVYDSEESAETAAQAALEVLKGRPGATWDLRKANPPKALGETAQAWQGENGTTGESLTAQTCVTIWRQANIVELVYAGGLMTMPVDICSTLAREAFSKAEAEAEAEA
jgi:hypothetical protein